MNIFSGYENKFDMSQLYTATYSCDFNLGMFPFDAQVEQMSSLFLRFYLMNIYIDINY